MTATLRKLYLVEIVAPLAVVVAMLASTLAGVPFAVRAPAIGIYRAFSEGISLAWFWAPIVLVVLHRKGRLDRVETDPTRLRIVLPLVRLLVCFAVVSLAYSNLKAVLPRINSVLMDSELLRVDTVLGFGRPWNERLGAIHAPWFVSLMNTSYLSFFFYFPVAMALAWFSADVEMLEEVIQGFAIVFCLGVVAYYLVPSAGTIYTHPEWHESAMSTEVWRVRDSLARQQQAIVLGRPTTIHAFFGIAAFPSLHIAHALVAVDIVRRRFRWIARVAVVPLVLMVISTLYFGWHYVSDHAGAVAVAWGALRIVRWDRARRVATAPVG
jgi:hypothetical protein